MVLPGFAQTGGQEATVFRADTRLVVVHATVTDKNGNLVTGLPRSAFSIYENDVKQDLKVFRREDIPVSFGLIVDDSASMREKREKVASAALDLVRESNPEDEVFIINFNDQTSLEQEYTSNIKQLEQALKRIDPRGGTAMRDALRMGVEHLRHGAKKDKRALLVITDGEDNSSLETLEHLVRSAQQNDVLIYAVGLLGEDDPHETQRATHELDTITQATGGRAWYPKSIAEIDGIAKEIAHDIRNQYTLGYSPTNQALDGTFRKIRVVVNSPDLVIRARSGYYAGRDSAFSGQAGDLPPAAQVRSAHR